MLKQAHAISEELIEWRRDFHMHPEIGFEIEIERQHVRRIAGPLADHACGDHSAARDDEDVVVLAPLDPGEELRDHRLDLRPGHAAGLHPRHRRGNVRPGTLDPSRGSVRPSSPARDGTSLPREVRV